MTVTPPVQDLIQRFFQLLTQRDLENLSELFSEEVDWYIPGNEEIAPWLGRRTSRKQVKDFYQLLWQNTHALSATIDKIFIDNEDAVISGEFSSKMLQTGNIVNSLFFIQIKVRNNLIVKYRLLEDSYAVFLALRSNSKAN
jgi:ketosteroid isomerase-like protein